MAYAFNTFGIYGAFIGEFCEISRTEGSHPDYAVSLVSLNLVYSHLLGKTRGCLKMHLASNGSSRQQYHPLQAKKVHRLAEFNNLISS